MAQSEPQQNQNSLSELIVIRLYCFTCKSDQKVEIRKSKAQQLKCPNCGSQEAVMKP